MVRLIYGEERFLVKREAKRFLKNAEKMKLQVLESSVYSQETIDAAMPGFMPSAVLIWLTDIRPLIECHVDISLIEQPVMVVLQIDPSEAELKKLPKGICLEKFGKVSIDEAKRFTAAYAGKIGKRITYDACDELLARIAFEQDNDVHLDNIFKELDKLQFLEGEITKDKVEAYVTPNVTYNAFQLAGMIEGKRDQEVFNFAERFFTNNKSRILEESLKLCGLLGQHYRVAYKIHFCNDYKELGVKKRPDKMSIEKSLNGLRLCVAASNRIKKGCAPDKELVVLLQKLLKLS